MKETDGCRKPRRALRAGAFGVDGSAGDGAGGELTSLDAGRVVLERLALADSQEALDALGEAHELPVDRVALILGRLPLGELCHQEIERSLEPLLERLSDVGDVHPAARLRQSFDGCGEVAICHVNEVSTHVIQSPGKGVRISK